jgi:hypothetical protein
VSTTGKVPESQRSLSEGNLEERAGETAVGNVVNLESAIRMQDAWGRARVVNRRRGEEPQGRNRVEPVDLDDEAQGCLCGNGGQRVSAEGRQSTVSGS